MINSARKPPVIRDNTDEEEEAIMKGIASDPDTYELDEQFFKKARRGRPPGRTKDSVTLRVDKDILAALKTPDPKGWQTRLNATLRKALELD